MVVFINPITGTETLVADERKDEYLGAGFVLAPGYVHNVKPIEKPVKEVKEEPKKEVKKATTTRTRKK